MRACVCTCLRECVRVCMCVWVQCVCCGCVCVCVCLVCIKCHVAKDAIHLNRKFRNHTVWSSKDGCLTMIALSSMNQRIMVSPPFASPVLRASVETHSLPCWSSMSESWSPHSMNARLRRKGPVELQTPHHKMKQCCMSYLIQTGLANPPRKWHGRRHSVIISLFIILSFK